jgi:hypothetical protein
MTLLCRTGLHLWGQWAKPHWHDHRWWQSRTCERCGKVDTVEAPNYRPSEEQLADLEKWASKLPKREGQPIRELFDLGEVEPRLKGIVVRVWTAGPTLGAILDHVRAMNDLWQSLASGADLADVRPQIDSWLLQAWGVTPKQLDAIQSRLSDDTYLLALRKTSDLLMSYFQQMLPPSPGTDATFGRMGQA